MKAGRGLAFGGAGMSIQACRERKRGLVFLDRLGSARARAGGDEAVVFLEQMDSLEGGARDVSGSIITGIAV
ncbi:hypothetical protein RB620_17945 [Paenibacillus sp. LHD-117]|uniref:hypothetical protein n=1 Tax=Paenibacillus sp. LHD-117 TaxID=3071412 RepID=UPI0027E0D578|nr:hypothetical protein [Paenibacillus sp. LHD-117]MDQ6421311.1 hypothetical protein [Paenibacillus sp. LHD-117]